MKYFLIRWIIYRGLVSFEGVFLGKNRYYSLGVLTTEKKKNQQVLDFFNSFHLN